MQNLYISSANCVCISKYAKMKFMKFDSAQVVGILSEIFLLLVGIRSSQLRVADED